MVWGSTEIVCSMHRSLEWKISLHMMETRGAMRHVGGKQLELSEENDKMEQSIVESDEGEYCCAGSMCGIDKSQTKLIYKADIRHQCCVCKKVMHGGICGAEALTVLTDQVFAVGAVVCFMCINDTSSKPYKLILFFHYCLFTYIVVMHLIYCYLSASTNNTVGNVTAIEKSPAQILIPNPVEVWRNNDTNNNTFTSNLATHASSQGKNQVKVY